jgi:hypothetical protein
VISICVRPAAGWHEAFTRERILKPIGMADSGWLFFAPVDRPAATVLTD